MIPVEQTILAPPDGNCFAACVASIFEVPIEAVPSIPEPHWWPAVEAWLAPRGLSVLHFAVKPDDDYRPPGYAIMHTDSPGGGCLHALVAKDGVVVWNPHPLRALGHGPVRGWTLFAILDPAKRAP